ncbi:MAG: DUF2889 domain-containing protein [Alphaproteobacteria bacterium]|nr:DUF2889 domain-containing protein [Alphaproteobacteria bacterium]MCB9931687.1 DUF2889 domain-containing protein [Alphaproteobacteria bacterium]
MPHLPSGLSEASAGRTPLHTRKVECQGYLREDGLFDIEGHITDTKPYPFDNHHRGTVEPGDPVHDMLVRITVDETLTIVAAEAFSQKTPYAICPLAALNFRRLAGIRIGPGYMRKVKALYGRDQGCTHILELLYPLGTTAFQTVFPYLEYRRRLDGVSEGESMENERLLNSCYAFSSRRSVVRELWPEKYEGPEEDEAADAAA